MINNHNNYNKSFRITENIGNNAFCFDRQKKTKIYIPSLITVDIIEFKSNIENYLKIWKNPVFREKQESSKSLSSPKKIIEYKWLQNFIKIENRASPLLQGEVGWGTIYIIDNHNHALYFRYKEYFDWNIQKWSELIHIDQHTDMNENKYKISIKQTPSLDKGMCPEGGGICKQKETIFNFTNNNCNVWNFIKPAIEEWLIWNITQINTEYSLLNNKLPPLCWKHERGDRGDSIHTEILDIDLDFRAPEMSIEKYQETINITKKLIQNSRVVTIATSPYFLDQSLAIKILKDLFK